ncbi:PREDICTED: uncharacterized protein LOC104591008, partial [Nelumbo nucifera]|uniref:Uncharacterized protein LOC104591008 n=1 Tax=Nelumbo nucifera TaxID=4432 RepID=A0A1U7Z6R6_NELNU
KRAFAAFKKAASLADSSPASVPLPLRVEPKPKSGIRQQDLLKNIVEIRPKRQRVSSPSNGNQQSPNSGSSPSKGNHQAPISSSVASTSEKTKPVPEKEPLPTKPTREEAETKPVDTVKSLLGLAYESSDDEEA